ncbi:nucleotidyltransferase family protein [Novosphingobium naphthalenivorans]|uniref:nucleotidyltransferase family protein n=1 Tax=Novosphingobium naphthalenivorans TaxID=273168 RepID=UPI000AFBDB24|nr:nucleotidyltransferase family protein [Novosphingobium naphthalenivorans]
MSLFPLLWGGADAACRAAGVLEDGGWRRLTMAARQHRLLPLLDARAQETGFADQAPPDLVSRWRAARRRSARRALDRRAVLARTADLFAAQGIDAVALKGAGVVWRDWIEPSLRPMRDLDLLVDGDAIGRADRLLRTHGFRGRDGAAPASEKHLAALVDETTGVAVELHRSTFDVHDAASAEREQGFRRRAVARSEPCEAAGGLRVFTSTDTLLHLILHAVCDHQFNNGPLLLLDMDVLVAKGGIDWPLFWSEAQACDAVRSAQLALCLARTYAGSAGIRWEGHEPEDLPPRVVENAARMMLVDMSRRAELGWAGRVAAAAPGARGAMLRKMIMRRCHSRGRRQPEPDARQGETAGGSRTVLKNFAQVLGVLASGAARRHLAAGLRVGRWLGRRA